MVGDGPERPKAEWLARTHGIEDDVTFVGKQNDMSQLLAISDILLLPSELESFGLVALGGDGLRGAGYRHSRRRYS